MAKKSKPNNRVSSPSQSVEQVSDEENNDVSHFDQTFRYFMDNVRNIQNDSKFQMDPRIKAQIREDFAFYPLIKQRVFLYENFSQQLFNQTFGDTFDIKRPGIVHFEKLYYSNHPSLNFVDHLPVSSNECTSESLFRLDKELMHSNNSIRFHVEIFDEFISKNQLKSEFIRRCSSFFKK